MCSCSRRNLRSRPFPTFLTDWASFTRCFNPRPECSTWLLNRLVNKQQPTVATYLSEDVRTEINKCEQHWSKDCAALLLLRGTKTRSKEELRPLTDRHSRDVYVLLFILQMEIWTFKQCTLTSDSKKNKPSSFGCIWQTNMEKVQINKVHENSAEDADVHSTADSPGLHIKAGDKINITHAPASVFTRIKMNKFMIISHFWSFCSDTQWTYALYGPWTPHIPWPVPGSWWLDRV